MQKYSFLFFFIVNCVYSQSLTIDNSNYTPTQLTNLLLGNSCVAPSNVLFSSSESVAYFNKNGSSFAMEEGVIIRNGRAIHTAGTYNNSNLSSQTNTNSDPYLQSLANQSGQNLQITDVAFLSFDFTSISSTLSFDFIFASNEYGEWQCGFSDVFAFVLTDMTTNISQNLAIVPGTTSPVSVLTIRDQAYNNSCISVNPSFFDVFNVNNSSSSVMNMRGYTKLMTAFAQVVPDRNYNIRLVIGDIVDSDYDSAIFLSSGSFQNEIDFGILNPYCDGVNMVLNSNLDDTIYDHEWFFNGDLIENNNTQVQSVTQTGLYELLITLPGSDCTINGAVTIAPLVYQNPEPLTVCINPNQIPIFDLTVNGSSQLELDNSGYSPIFFASIEDFQNNIPISNPESYIGFDGQIIYIGLFHEQSQTFCSEPINFQLNILDVLVLDDPSPVKICFNDRFSINLIDKIPLFLNTINPDLVEVSFYTSDPLSDNEAGLILNPESFSIQGGLLQQTLWIKVSYLFNDACLVILPFDIEINGLPVVPILENATVCESYELPLLSSGSYYSQSGGNGINYLPGDIIDFSTTMFVFSGFDENGCSNESSFFINVLQDFTLVTDYCGSFIIPFVESGAFYTQPNGPNGNGALLNPGTEITNSQTIYFYSVVDDVFCVEKEFDIVINPLPLVDTLSDAVVCGSYILPVLNHGAYRTSSGGAGNVLFAGQAVSNSMTIYIFAENEFCTNESLFNVTIVSNFQNIQVCGAYTLPIPNVGGFFTEPAGQGLQFESGSQILETTLIYYYVNTTELPNCTDNFSFLVSIAENPEIDIFDDVTICSNQVPYLLPNLSVGEYFTQPNRQGVQLFPGDEVSVTTTLYVNAIQTQFGLNCQSEDSFTINIRPLPPVENFSDIYSCAEYPLPNLSFGTYYTGPNATGDVIPPGTIINQEQIIYIYNEWEDLQGCGSQSVFTVFPLGVVLPDYQDVLACDFYVLPPLTIGNFYTEPDGNGTLLPSGTVISESQTIYAYVFDGTRIICEDQKSFDVTITTAPTLPVFSNIQACQFYQLPALDSSVYNVFYTLDASGDNPLSDVDTLIDVPGNYTIYVFASLYDNPDCRVQAQFQLQISPLRVLDLTDGSICVDPITNEVLEPYIIQSGLNAQLFNVEWYLNGNFVGTSPNWIATEPGTYIARPVMLTSEGPPNCPYEDAILTVSFSSIPDAVIQVTNDFSNNSDVIVQIVNGLGQYEYQLDDGDFQSSPIFENVPTGYHTVTIKDTFGVCGQITLEAIVISYPNFFTPNGDGSNDFWMIQNLVFLPGAKIVIMDRYGKIMTQLNHNSRGWNGEYNGQPMPSTDYWFVVYYQRNNEPKEFKAHFSMKR